jgi:hypothetical protein
MMISYEAKLKWMTITTGIKQSPGLSPVSPPKRHMWDASRRSYSPPPPLGFWPPFLLLSDLLAGGRGGVHLLVDRVLLGLGFARR